MSKNELKIVTDPKIFNKCKINMSGNRYVDLYKFVKVTNENERGEK